MICPSCQAEVPAGFKFCGSCGIPLIITCGKCGAEVPPGFKFCGACGTPLASPIPAPGPPVAAELPVATEIPKPSPPGVDRRTEERKIVTVLFADVRGFTALSEKMDPEEVRDMIQSLFGRLSDAIRQFGGTVDKYIGDCVMALFGAPIAHENDPERAIRAALGMRQEFLDFREKRGIDVGIRIGINTGMVLAGYLGDRAGDYTVMGDEVNLASRMEQAAPENGILVSHKTYHHVHGLFDVDQLDPIAVKGKKDLIRVYLVLREAAALDTHQKVRGRRIDTRMVGRSSELGAMLAVARESRESGERRFLLVTAPAGVGKSRLLYEFHQELMDSGGAPRTFKGRSLPYSTQIPNYLFSDLLKHRFGIIDEDNAFTVRGKLVQGVEAVMEGYEEKDAVEVAHLMGRLINIDFPDSPHLAALKDDPVQLNQRARQAFLDFFRAAASEPIVCYLEDMQWAEQSSVDLVREIYQDNRRRPVLMVAIARPELFEKFPEFESYFPGAVRVTLDHLPPEAVQEMIRELLRKVRAVPESVDRMVIEKTGGNPYYVEETIKMLIDTGVVDRSGDEWTIVESKFAEVVIPDTIQGLLQARLDNLSVNEKGVLQRASIVGRTFWQKAIDILLADMTIDACEPVLRELRKKEYVFDTQQSSFMGAEYIFKHALLRDVTYESILRKKRSLYHAQLADWIEQNGGDRKDEYLPLIAMHYELGGNNEEAKEHYFLAGLRAQTTFSNREALGYYQKAIELAARPGCSHYRRRGMMHEVLGNYQSALDDYKSTLNLARDETYEGIAYKHLTEIHIRTGNYDEAMVFAEKAMKIGQKISDGRMMAEMLNLIGRIHDFTGDTEKALQFYTMSTEAHRESKDALGEAVGLGNIGIIHMYRGEYDKAIRAYKAALEIDRGKSNKRRMTIMLSNIGEAYQFLGAIEEAVMYHKEALALARSIGFTLMQVEVQRNLGLERVLLGEREEGIRLLRESLEMVEDLQDMELMPQVLHSLAEGLLACGENAEAERHVARLVATAEEHNVKDFLAKGLLLRARCAGWTGCVPELQRALALAKEIRSTMLMVGAHHALALAASDVALRKNHLDSARSHIDTALKDIADEKMRHSFLRSRQVAPVLELWGTVEMS